MFFTCFLVFLSLYEKEVLLPILYDRDTMKKNHSVISIKCKETKHFPHKKSNCITYLLSSFLYVCLNSQILKVININMSPTKEHWDVHLVLMLHIALDQHQVEGIEGGADQRPDGPQGHGVQIHV